MGLPADNSPTVLTIAITRIAALREGLEAVKANLSPRDAATLKIIQALLTADDLFAGQPGTLSIKQEVFKSDNGFIPADDNDPDSVPHIPS